MGKKELEYRISELENDADRASARMEELEYKLGLDYVITKNGNLRYKKRDWTRGS